MDHLSDDCLYYPIFGIFGSYDHETNDHNRIISLEREINLRNLQHPFKRCKVYGSSIHTTTDHYNTELFKRGEALQAKRSCSVKSNGLVFFRITFLVQVLSDQYGQNDQTDNNDQDGHTTQLNEILNDDSLGHSNHNNDNLIIDKLTNTEDIRNPELSSLVENNSVSSLVQLYSICTTSTHVPNQILKPWLSEAKGFILSNHDTGRILPAESQRNSTDPSVDEETRNFDL
ncbi:hypothetical protein Tco_0948252 [Tanacetum coccineum]